jgi:hypothetical protein
VFPLNQRRAAEVKKAQRSPPKTLLLTFSPIAIPPEFTNTSCRLKAEERMQLNLNNVKYHQQGKTNTTDSLTKPGRRASKM